MSYLVFALGLLLAIFGAAAISFGYGIIDVERGWANVISGAVALSGGIVTIALAMILHSLSGLRPLLKAERARAAAVDAPAEARRPLSLKQRLWRSSLRLATRQALKIRRRSSPRNLRGRHVAGCPSAPRSCASRASARRSSPPAAISDRRAEAAARAEASIEDIRRVVAQTIKRASSQRRAEGEAAAPAEAETASAPSLRRAAAPAGGSLWLAARA